jgi:hypothetical protein
MSKKSGGSTVVGAEENQVLKTAGCSFRRSDCGSYSSKRDFKGSE